MVTFLKNMKGKYRALVIFNTITLGVMLLANYLSGVGFFSDLSVADVSHKYDTLFAPAGYAFAIWGLIFLMCICFVVYQWILLKSNDPRKYIQRTGSWFAISNLANTLWLYCWTNEMIGLSVICILILLLSLCVLTIRLRLELDDEPVRTIFFVWWPIVHYLGWIMVATIACLASWFVYKGWFVGILSDEIWTIIMIYIACLLYLILVRKRNLREGAAVGIWAFVAIAVRQWNNHNNIVTAALIAAIILFIVIAMHGYRNRAYSPTAKIKRNEWK